MSLTLADIERWNSGQVREVSTALDATSTSMDGVKDGLRNLPILGTWSGQAADAATDSLDKLGTYLSNNVAARQEAAKVIGRAADEIDGLKQLLQHVLDFAKDKFSVDLANGTVTPLNDDVSQSDQDYVTTTLQQVLAAAGAVDRELAHGLNLLDGTDQPGSPPTIPIDQTSERARNQIEAFKQVYGREPESANDWRMAAGLDPNSYALKNYEAKPEIVAGRFTPQPGKGVVRTNWFIPAEWVQNSPQTLQDFKEGRLAPQNYGDYRGPSATADPEDSRVSLFVDYENGVVVVRQNPTATVDGLRGGAAAAHPQVFVAEAPDGRLTIDYNTWDAYEPQPAIDANLTVNGRITLDPQDNGSVALGGNVTIYPSMETYQYQPGVPPETLQWTPANSGSEWGPASSLMRSHWVGDATIPAVKPDIPEWRWQFENAVPFAPDPFVSHTTKLDNPFDGSIPHVSKGR
ncbi:MULTISPECIES: WXG100 family type VII secretion target [unclassified Mycolicibacterium]|uniref:WXG100 family type VII secretion target n=1 Tax=unclassified Mycolicibacterium TaxID=2636767 RepID=UPI0012DE9921|nr:MULTISPECIES: WXG100 family type VII secretion target [unclassified Mycolicibacterium]MUL84312.1 WXG100 family type VII secretion target [Mycolicibacterium sp. CBMA 329]MUL89622.1 WXG100 family type VII secretion target [Mycolicibacterium sp. CBMA 331]MUL99798.1 WXG100 family type VII secretion target [Mycolicibacterium sp. CBMA 334]MUM29815.1 WXG100 family type VII secretion target [Mycolicibacterium sp. CBMA 295]MUM39137.1 WXG100 family type VII secretion target [Mycolicibacterium sp. CBM